MHSTAPVLPSRPDRAAPVFELCAETLSACLAARHGGADRIELCSALALDGLTPSHGLTREAVRLAALPIHVLVRPRAGDFVYTPEEFAIMREDLRHALSLDVAGFALGVLHSDGTVDIDRTQELVALAAGREVTFHRAFDRTPSLADALEDVIRTGCYRVLTSGGAPDIVTGTPTLRELVEQAHGRVAIAAGGGLRRENAAAVAAGTRAPHLHGSLRSRSAPDSSIDTFDQVPATIRAEDVRAIVAELRRGARTRHPLGS